MLTHERISLLGVLIDPLTQAEALHRIEVFLAEPRLHHIMTPNAEMLVETTRNAPFRELLNHTDLNIADSIGLVWMARWTGQYLPERVTGVDTVEQFCAHLSSEHPVFLLGAALGIAEKAAATLVQKNPQMKIAGTFSGSPKAEDAADIIQRINDSGAHILLVAFGAPKQDHWIAEHTKDLPHVRIAMGVGGTFDFLAGKQVRAPSFMRAIGLEWLWRVIREPRRITRILTAVITFPLLVLRYGKHAPPQST